MRHVRNHRPGRVLAAVALAALGLAACSGGGNDGGAGATATTAVAQRPSSPAKLSIVSPRNGQTVHGPRPALRLDLRGAEIVSQTTTRIRGDQGHVHLFVDGKLVTMNYGLRERLPQLTPGQHVVQVEFVAADHAPFDPRVLTQAAFEVAP
jgi:hypothetical protein